MNLISALAGHQETTKPLWDVIADLPQLPDDFDFGDDINTAHEVLLSAEASEEEKRAALFKFTGRRQPCLFGRLASHADKGESATKGLGIDLVWIHEWEMALDRDYVAAKIQRARRAWKDRAERGESSGFLIMFNSRKLAYAKPGKELLDVCVEVSNLYLVENAPIEVDVIYTEAVPLRRADGQLTVFKAGCNIFYAGAHRTVNHDRRLPGGLMFSMNSPGHFANSLALRGIRESFEDAVDFVRETAFRSIGNGGIGCPHMPSASWHNEADDNTDLVDDRKRPHYIPDNFDPSRYSAVYHTDVLCPTAVTTDDRLVKEDFSEINAEVWPYLILDYITTEEFPEDHVNHGLFHGHPIEDCGKYHNPWPPRVAHNKELFEY
ncbi:MAG: hypothetical protein ABW224_10920 [Kibdelosporangium sp.]